MGTWEGNKCDEKDLRKQITGKCLEAAGGAWLAWELPSPEILHHPSNQCCISLIAAGVEGEPPPPAQINRSP